MGNVAVVTGAAKRMGRELAMNLHEQGYDVALHYFSSKEEASSLETNLNKKRKDSAKIFQAELSDKNQLKTLTDAILSWRASVDVLINNASSFVKDDEVNGDHLFHTNVRAPYLLTHLLKSSLEAKKGCIINIADIYGETPLAGYDLYCMSKASLLMQTKCMAVKLAPAIRVNAILPGVIAWPENEEALSPSEQEAMLSQSLLKKIGGFAAITKAVRYLIGNDFVTGTKIVVDGGRNH